MTQGKIERYHRSMKNIVNTQNYFLPGQLETEIASFVAYYNHQRYHESLDNLTPADIYFGRAKEVLTRYTKVTCRFMLPTNLHFSLFRKELLAKCSRVGMQNAKK